MVELNYEHSELLAALQTVKHFCFNHKCCDCPLLYNFGGRKQCQFKEAPPGSLSLMRVKDRLVELEDYNDE